MKYKAWLTLPLLGCWQFAEHYSLDVTRWGRREMSAPEEKRAVCFSKCFAIWSSHHSVPKQGRYRMRQLCGGELITSPLVSHWFCSLEYASVVIICMPGNLFHWTWRQGWDNHVLIYFIFMASSMMPHIWIVYLPRKRRVNVTPKICKGGRIFFKGGKHYTGFCLLYWNLGRWRLAWSGSHGPQYWSYI